MMSAKLWAPALTACALATSIALVGCSKDPKDAQQATAAQQMPPTEVGVIVAQPQSVEQVVELTGRTSPYEVSEVRPQANGIVLKRLFAEGSYIREGQPLFEIDPSIYRATLASAKAALLSKEATLNTLQIKTKRYKQLVGIDAVAKQEYDDLVGQLRAAEADVAASQAEIRNAQINLGYTTVRSPISGQSGPSSFTAGALVTASQAAPLVTIRRLDPIYVDINQSSAELLRLRQELSKGSIDRSNNTKVRLRLEDGSYYNVEGNLAFSEASVNPDTGTVTLRAVFANPNHLLLPGMFANAEIVQGMIPNAYLVPQIAVTRTPTGQATAMFVNAKGKVEVRNIDTVGTKGSDWIVTKGVASGDKIIVDGVAKIKADQQVTAKPYQAPAAAPAAPTAPTASADKAAAQSDAQSKTEQKATSTT